jgi:hypothetical protein
MVCRYCGLETGAGVSHCSGAECIQALNAEIDRAKRLIGQGRESVAGRRQLGGNSDAATRPEGALIEPA